MNLEKFNENTMYIFSKEKYGKVNDWSNLCHNRIVEVESEGIGTIKVNGEEYIVFPKWCNEVRVQCTSTEKGNVYKENIRNSIKDINDK